MVTILKWYKPSLFLIRYRRTFAFASNSKTKFRPRGTFCAINCNLRSESLTTCCEEKNLGSGDENLWEIKKQVWLYNTMSKQTGVFKPKVQGKVGMYVCSVTAYDLSHIGHAHVYIAFDVLYRFLKYLGYEVNYVRNFTYVDDKIIARANELGEDPISLSRRYCEEFHHGMAYLNCLPPSMEPRVSDHIPQIIDMIRHVLH